MLWATFLSQNIYVYLQPLLRNAPRKLPSSVKNAKYGPFRRSRSFKVTDFGTKLIYDFLSVITSYITIYIPELLYSY